MWFYAKRENKTFLGLAKFYLNFTYYDCFHEEAGVAAQRLGGRGIKGKTSGELGISGVGGMGHISRAPEGSIVVGCNWHTLG